MFINFQMLSFFVVKLFNHTASESSVGNIPLAAIGVPENSENSFDVKV